MQTGEWSEKEGSVYGLFLLSARMCKCMMSGEGNASTYFAAIKLGAE